MTRPGTGNGTDGAGRAGADRPGAKPDRVLPLLRGALPPALVVGVLAMAGGGLLAGGRGVAGAALGLVVVALFSGTGLLAVRAVRDQDPMITMVVALGSYTLRVVLFGVAFALLSRLDVDSVLDRTAFVISVLACVTAWIAGEIRAFGRMRVPTYDVELPASGAERADPGGDTAVVSRGEDAR